MKLLDLVKAEQIDLPAVAQLLDTMEHDARVAAVRRLPGKYFAWFCRKLGAIRRGWALSRFRMLIMPPGR